MRGVRLVHGMRLERGVRLLHGEIEYLGGSFACLVFVGWCP